MLLLCGHSALHRVSPGPVCRYLLRCGVDPNSVAPDGCVCVSRSPRRRKRPAGSPTRARRYTALHHAVWHGQDAAALCLLEHGASAAVEGRRAHDTPVALALTLGNQTLAAVRCGRVHAWMLCAWQTCKHACMVVVDG